MLSTIKIAIIPSSGSSRNFKIELEDEVFSFSALLIIYIFLFPITGLLENSFWSSSISFFFIVFPSTSIIFNSKNSPSSICLQISQSHFLPFILLWFGHNIDFTNANVSLFIFLYPFVSNI